MGARQERPGISSIVEEIIFALLDHLGDFFVDSHRQGAHNVPPPNESTLRVSSDLSFLTNSEREVAERLLQLAYHCHALESFIYSKQLSWNQEDGSHYSCALANGICELLNVYGTAVIKVHTRMQCLSCPSLATLNYYLAEFKVLLPCIHAIAYEVESRNLKGSEILHLLHHKAGSCGIQELRSCIGRLQWHSHQKLFKQLRAWMVYGMLEDQHQEFFIQRAAEHGIQARAGEGSPSQAALDWHKGFEVRMDLLPPEITGDTPLSILFIGKAVRALGQPGNSLPEDPLGAGAALDSLQAAPAFDAGQFELVIENIRAQAAEELWRLLVVQRELPLQLRALRNYFLLGRGDFWQAFLLESAALMSQPVIAATAEANIGIPFQQSAAKSSAALDPFFARLQITFPADSQLAEESGSTLPSLAPKTREAQPSAQFSRSSMATSSLLTPAFSKLPEHLSFTGMLARSSDSQSPRITPQTGDPQAAKTKRSLKVPEYDANWDPLTLEYEVQWPLHLLVSQETLLRYSRMFQYLFRLKRLQLDLEEGWAALKSQRQALRPAHNSAPLWHVRAHMAHYVNNLLLYIQVDVIEVQFKKMLDAMKESQDLKAAARAHEGFMAACIIQSCLDVPIFSRLLSKILVICRAFCGYLKNSASDLSAQDANPARLADDFHRSSRLLFKLLSTPSMQSRARAPFLRQLLLRLDFNGFVQHNTDSHAANAHAQPSAKPAALANT